ncbi:MAG: PEP-CTERM sorting domain-containing protein [Planctomycetes bacterium]|nr:PEP-CTERM sorting domain-containing protein [Planctomycetota bacterium]
MLTKNWTRSVVLGAALWATLGAINASAALVITNGTFTQGGGYNANVVDWFDGTAGGAGNPYQDTFIDTNPQPPASGTEVVFSGNASPAPQNFLYQAIGTKGATDGTLNFSVNIGNFSTSTTYRGGTLEINLFRSGTFVGADGTDVLGAAGVTQIGSTITKAIDRGGSFPNSAYETGSFNIASVNPLDTFYLRFHWTPTGVDSYIGADLVTITVDAVAVDAVPEPSTFVLATLGLAALGLVGWKRRVRG